MALCNADKLLLGGSTLILASAATLGPSALSIGLPLGLLATLLADGIARPSSSLLYPTVVRGRRDRPQVALTFDDGPDPQTTPFILDVLAKHDARGTFFTIGQHLQQHTAIGRRMIDAGHEIGSHSWRHVRWQNFYGRARQAEDLQRTADFIRELTRIDREPLYRPPVGLKSPPLARAAQARGLRMIAWSIHSRDTTTHDPQRIAARVLKHIGPGDIVLMHDGHDLPGRHRLAGAQAVPLILAGLRERGLQAVTVSELID